MIFKKVSQIIWMILVFIFLLLMFLWIWSNSVELYKKDFTGNGLSGIVVWKVNKLTGSISRGMADTVTFKGYSWYKLENLEKVEDNEEKEWPNLE